MTQEQFETVVPVNSKCRVFEHTIDDEYFSVNAKYTHCDSGFLFFVRNSLKFQIPLKSITDVWESEMFEGVKCVVFKEV